MNGSFTIEQWLNLARVNSGSIVRDMQTSGILTETLHEYLDGKLPEWYGVTDVVNPVRKYYDVKHPEIVDPPELAARYEHGNVVQDAAFHWFSAMPGFEGREVEATGNDIGITGLRGRMDFVFSNHIVEFKTTTHGIFTPADILEKNPQDLEQLVTYALLTQRTDEDHFLVYSSEDYENSFRAFTVNVTGDDFARHLRDRLDSLRNAIEHDNPSGLAKCRYYEFGCKFRESGTCNCDELKPLDNDALNRSVRLSRNEELEKELEQKKKSASEVQAHKFTIWDLLTPRKAYLRELGILEESEEGMDPEDKEIRRKTGNAIFNSPLYVQRREVSMNGYSLGQTTMLSIQATDSEGNSLATRLYPSTDRIFNRDPAELSSDSISPYHLLRLAMICSLSGSNIGYLLMGFKDDGKRIESYRVTFRNLTEVRKRMNDRITELESSVAGKDPAGLPVCPRFLVESCGDSCLCKTS